MTANIFILTTFTKERDMGKILKVLGAALGVAFVLAVCVGSFTIASTVLAQTVADTTPDPATAIVGWVCSNQVWVVYLLGGLIAHTGFSFLSAGLKKLGVTPEMVGPIAGKLVQVIRIFAVDVKPPASTIVSNAATVLADAGRPEAPAVAQAAVDMKVAAAAPPTS